MLFKTAQKRATEALSANGLNTSAITGIKIGEFPGNFNRILTYMSRLSNDKKLTDKQRAAIKTCIGEIGATKAVHTTLLDYMTADAMVVNKLKQNQPLLRMLSTPTIPFAEKNKEVLKFVQNTLQNYYDINFLKNKIHTISAHFLSP